jgi:hypothetical protein
MDDGLDDVAPENITSWHDVSAAYPLRTLTQQSELGLYQPGVVTGYLLDDNVTAVLSLPTFSAYDDGIDTFSEAVGEFVGKSSTVQRVVIDLQQNSGGSVGLALETFRMFFPSLVPLPESRMRATPMINALGQTYTNYFNNITDDDDEAFDFVAEEWVASRRINAQTGQPFSSWDQFFGPAQGDFTLAQQYNLTDEDFVAAAFGIVYPDGSFNGQSNDATPWPGDKIILLTDGQCSSACSLFVEMMTRVKGVRTVVVGGMPTPGPMQAVSGNRGAAAYSSAELDEDIEAVREYNASTQVFLPPRGNATDTGLYVTYAGINLRDQIRANASMSNQFLYLPADCRLYWSFANFFDYNRLWADAARLFNNDTSLCVPGSVNAKTPSQHLWQPRAAAAKSFSMGDYIMQGLSSDASVEAHDSDIVHDAKFIASASSPVNCDNNGKPVPGRCGPGLRCKQVSTKCSSCQQSGADGQCLSPVNDVDKTFFCLSECSTAIPRSCAQGTNCQAALVQNTGKNLASTVSTPNKSPKNVKGFCFPNDPPKRKDGSIITCTALRNSRKGSS